MSAKRVAKSALAGHVMSAAAWHRGGHFRTLEAAKGAFQLAYQQGLDGMGKSTQEWMGLTEKQYAAWMRDSSLPPGKLTSWFNKISAQEQECEAASDMPSSCVTPHDGGNVLRKHSVRGWWQVWSGGICVCLLSPDDFAAANILT